MTFWQQVKLLRNRWWVVLACVLIGTGSAFLVSSQQPKVYTARADLIAQTMASTFAQVAVSRSVLVYVASELGLSDTPEDLAKRVQATADLTSDLLTITVTDSDPVRAASLATAIANRLVQIAPDVTGTPATASGTIQDDLNTVQTEIARAEAGIAALSSKSSPTPAQSADLDALHASLISLLTLKSSLLDLAASSSKILPAVLDPATPPTAPASPKVPLVTAIGALLGLAIGMGAALVVPRRGKPIADRQS